MRHSFLSISFAIILLFSGFIYRLLFNTSQVIGEDYLSLLGVGLMLVLMVVSLSQTVLLFRLGKFNTSFMLMGLILVNVITFVIYTSETSAVSMFSDTNIFISIFVLLSMVLLLFTSTFMKVPKDLLLVIGKNVFRPGKRLPLSFFAKGVTRKIWHKTTWLRQERFVWITPNYFGVKQVIAGKEFMLNYTPCFEIDIDNTPDEAFIKNSPSRFFKKQVAPEFKELIVELVASAVPTHDQASIPVPRIETQTKKGVVISQSPSIVVERRSL